eukprot:5214803-Amphidinium_carterae.1
MPPAALKSLCGSVTCLVRYAQHALKPGDADQASLRKAAAQFVRVAAVRSHQAQKLGSEARAVIHFGTQLQILRVAADLGMWSSDAYPLLSTSLAPALLALDGGH